jgi:hypothetical protein
MTARSIGLCARGRRYPRLMMFVAVGVVTYPGVAHGEPILFTETISGTGSLGQTAFSDALVTVSLVGDTSTVTETFPGIFVDFGRGSVDIAGVGSTTFTDTIGVVDNQALDFAGIGDFTNRFEILGTEANPALVTYDLRHAIGPLSGIAVLEPPSGGFPTLAGRFDLTGDGPSTITATLSPTPEPATLVLVATGMAGFNFRRRRRESRSGGGDPARRPASGCDERSGA